MPMEPSKRVSLVPQCTFGGCLPSRNQRMIFPPLWNCMNFLVTRHLKSLSTQSSSADRSAWPPTAWTDQAESGPGGGATEKRRRRPREANVKEHAVGLDGAHLSRHLAGGWKISTSDWRGGILGHRGVFSGAGRHRRKGRNRRVKGKGSQLGAIRGSNLDEGWLQLDSTIWE